MSKNTLISLVVIAIILIGGYFAYRAHVPANGNDTNAITETTKKMAFTDFLKNNSGQSYKCTVNQYIGDQTLQGTTYIADNMIRGEYKTAIEGANMDSYVIIRDGFAYSWIPNLANSGFKTELPKNETGGIDATAQGVYGFDQNQIGDYNCEVWTPDLSMFTLPTNVTFRDLGTK